MVKTSDHDIVSFRVFDAPIKRIWEAFTNPGTLARWWGPEGFTNVFEVFDLRAGGEWRFTMRAPNGDEYPMRKIFVEIVTPERIVFDHPDPVHGHRMTMTLRETETGNGTEMTWHMHFDTAEEAVRVRAFIKAANEQNFDRLRTQLAAAEIVPL